ncbi:hypothetical protein [Massilia sp. IC2-476]|uniref:hypothetical protein n=1 Tax=Massilia sp. IC2-476 TaxID=2887199 RepID=UPI001D11E8C4|nr:hypothetical protein [Massilia sp. IC2-476]MCC2970333.1 hypothetical protein [Massilia sp. IC2-476]
MKRMAGSGSESGAHYTAAMLLGNAWFLTPLALAGRRWTAQACKNGYHRVFIPHF